ncbi:MAG: efflux RND transporter periplasmic adaptor subunit [Silvanigrellaceae bacterium]
MPHISFQRLVPRLAAAGLSITLWACTGKKVDLPPEAPEIRPLEASATIDVASSNTAVAATHPETSTVSSPAEKSEPSNQASSTTRTTPVASQAQASESVASITRVSGQVNSGKQGQASFKIAGHISKTIVQVGEKIRKGQVLAVLDETDAQLRMRLAQNQFEQARVTFDQARKDMQREEQLKKEGATTQSNLERMSNALAAARINQSQAEINLKQAEKNLADTKLTAAFDGVVARRLKVDGEYVGVGAAVFELASMNELEVSLRVPENLIKKVRPGNQISLSIPSLGKETQAKILRIVPVIQENSRTFEVIGRVQGTLPGEIIPGQFVEAQL